MAMGGDSGLVSGTARVRAFSHSAAPFMEVVDAAGRQHRIEMTRDSDGRKDGEALWSATVTDIPLRGDWCFRVVHHAEPQHGIDAEMNRFFHTPLRDVWVQDGQVFDYKPAAHVSAPRVLRVLNFGRKLTQRPLYVYLPRGYGDHMDRRYPVLYMHDGQNCFESFAADSFAGSWKADETATRLIGGGRMRECVIVAVGHGGERRLVEYTPPYCEARIPAKLLDIRKEPRRDSDGEPDDAHLTGAPETTPAPDEDVPMGEADKTFAAYRDEVLPYVRRNYRVLTRREDMATCGSSMGGLFATYIAWEHPEFARNHAAVSPSYWITKRDDGKLEIVERMRRGAKRDLRLWLDSGTRSTEEGGDDGMWNTFQARDALIENGYRLGADFWHHLHFDATHSEKAWASRLDRIFEFLFPAGADGK